MIDKKSREKLYEDIRLNNLGNTLSNSIKESLSKFSGNDDASEKRAQRSEFLLVSLINKFEKGIVLLYRGITALKVDIPSVFKVKGSVDIGRMPSVEITNLNDIKQYFTILEKKFGDITEAVSNIKINVEAPQVNIPPITIPDIKIPTIEIPKDKSKGTNDKLSIEIINAIKSLDKSMNEFSDKVTKAVKKTPEFPDTIKIGNFPPQMVPQPVTNININALNGVMNATTVLVSGSATALPSTNIKNRRSLLIYNSDTSKTLYIGGSTVAASGSGQGLPVPPLSYAPSLNAGSNMAVYGITASGTLSVNILEMSNESDGR